MTEIFTVAYEGDAASIRALDYAITRATKAGAALHIVHVLEWSPYKFLTPDEVAERHQRRTDELARARAAVIAPAIAKAEAAGLSATGDIFYGNVVDLVVEAATKIGAAQIFVGRAGGNAIAARVFGSVPLGLAASAPIPTVIVP